MTINEAIKTLDGVIPSPNNKMVDYERLKSNELNTDCKYVNFKRKIGE